MDKEKGTKGKREQRKAIAILCVFFIAIVLVVGGIGCVIGSILAKHTQKEQVQQTVEPEKPAETVVVEVPKEVQNEQEETSAEESQQEEPQQEEAGDVSISQNEAEVSANEALSSEARPKDARALVWADEQLSQMSLEQKVAQLFIITPEALTGYKSVVGEAKEKTRNALKQYPVGGVIYYDKNIASVNQVTALLTNTKKYVADQSEVPIFLAIDEEGGELARVANYRPMKATKVDNMSDIGAAGDKAVALEAGETIGTYLSELGFNLDFAPVADVLVDTNNQFMAKRSFGEAPNLVWEMDEQFLKGLNNHQVAGCLKHFPGYALTSKDPHKGFVEVDLSLEELRAYAFVPFEKGCQNGAEMIMVGQTILTGVTDDGLPSCLSEDIVTGILRDTFAYDGVLVTDVMNKGAVAGYAPDEASVMAISAGMDMLLVPKDFKKAYQGILTAVKNGELTEERIDESVKRILTMKYRYRE